MTRMVTSKRIYRRLMQSTREGERQQEREKEREREREKKIRLPRRRCLRDSGGTGSLLLHQRSERTHLLPPRRHLSNTDLGTLPLLYRLNERLRQVVVVMVMMGGGGGGDGSPRDADGLPEPEKVME